MSSTSRAVAVWQTFAALGFVAAFVLLSQRYAAPTPRADLLACFAVSALGVAGCLATVRRRAAPELGGVGTRPWWPDLRALWRGLFPLTWVMILVYFVPAMVQTSPAARQMVEEGHVIAPVRVTEVLSTERKGRDRVSRYYTVKVRATVPYDAGDETRTVEFDSKRREEPGDKVWALYAPSAPQLDVFLEDDRAELEEKAGGPESSVPYLVLALLLALGVAALFHTAPGLPRHVRRALRESRVRSLPVRITDGRAALAKSPSATDYDKTGPDDPPEPKPAPCLALEGPGGERLQAVVGNGIDPQALTTALDSSGQQPPWTLYWIASGHQETQGLLLAGDHSIRCRKVTERDTDGPPTGGEPVTKIAGPRGRPREVRRHPEWRADLHTTPFGWILVTLTLLAVIALGVGLIASIVLAIVSTLTVFLACYGPSVERGEALGTLMPTPSRHNPQDDHHHTPEGDEHR